MKELEVPSWAEVGATALYLQGRKGVSRCLSCMSQIHLAAVRNLLLSTSDSRVDAKHAATVLMDDQVQCH